MSLAIWRSFAKRRSRLCFRNCWRIFSFPEQEEPLGFRDWQYHYGDAENQELDRARQRAQAQKPGFRRDDRRDTNGGADHQIRDTIYG